MLERSQIRDSKRWVVKIGSALLTDNAAGLNKELIQDWAGQIAELRTSGLEIIVVSSGSIAAGMQRLGWRQRPHSVHHLQAAAAVGQMGLVHLYEFAFQQHGIHTAQILLTNADLAHRQRYLNARSALRTLLDLGIIPVVNENDTVVTDEIQFGDNDTLAALVANLVEADLLVILTDQSGLFAADPRTHPNARFIEEADAGDPALGAMAGTGSAVGRGGMVTKLAAAEKAARSGTATVIASGKEPDVLLRFRRGEALGTLLKPVSNRIAARKQWLAGHLQPRGRLILDDGAVTVLRKAGRSLLPVGVKTVHGEFQRGELVICENEQGREIARGLINYTAAEARKIIGRPSAEIESILGYVDESELIHRDNMVVL